MKNKIIKNHFTAQKVDMWWILLYQALPIGNIEYIDPFLLIHHLEETYPWWQRAKDLWVGPHPHRWFSPVSFIYKWENEHRDSQLNRAIIWEWGTQWMDVGMGITHSERPSEKMAIEWWEYELIQIWINTLSKHKMDQPYYVPLSKEETPIYHEKWVEISVIAGEYKWIVSPIKIHSALCILRITMQWWNDVEIDIPKNFNTILYTLDDGLEIEWKKIWKKQVLEFNNNWESIIIKAYKTVRYIILSWEPLWEDIDQHGPFVMNTRSEILQAMWDYQKGKMWVLIEEFE